MSTLTAHNFAQPVALRDHPLAVITAAVREHCRSLGLNFILADECLKAAREQHYLNRSPAFAISVGNALADKHAARPKMHAWRNDPNGPRAA